MKITGTSKVLEQFVDGIEPRTAVGELNIGQDQAGPLLARSATASRLGARDAEHPVAEAFDQRLEVHRDEGLVLDDQDVGRDLGRELAAGFLDQRAQGRHVHLENPGRVLLGKALQRDQQEGLARLGVRLASRRSAGMSGSTGAFAVQATEFQILVNRR